MWLWLVLLIGGATSPRFCTTTDPPHIAVIAPLPAGLQTVVPMGALTQQQGERWMPISILDLGEKPGLPILGRYQRRETELVFIPGFALVPGERYRAALLLGDETATVDYLVPSEKPSVPPAVVVQVFPTGSTLPANQLKFYLHFSQPMREGDEIFERIEILDESGQRIVDPWRRPELWTADARRLTVWVHPGRIKRGVVLRDELGPILEAGRTYTLVVRREVQDASGRPLTTEFRKRFTTTDADRACPNPGTWRFTYPTTASREAVVLTFPETLDSALLRRCLEVHDHRGKAVPGTVHLGSEEQSWSFIPRDPWSEMNYSVDVDPLLEDLAGNTPARLFDTDLTEPPPAPPLLRLEFRPRKTAESQAVLNPQS